KFVSCTDIEGNVAARLRSAAFRLSASARRTAAGKGAAARANHRRVDAEIAAAVYPASLRDLPHLCTPNHHVSEDPVSARLPPAVHRAGLRHCRHGLWTRSGGGEDHGPKRRARTHLDGGRHGERV